MAMIMLIFTLLFFIMFKIVLICLGHSGLTPVTVMPKRRAG